MEICIKWSMCRTCTSDSSAELQPLFEDDNVVKQLQAYAGVKVQPADGLPDQICTSCVEQLQLVDTFLTGCRRADEQLRHVVRRTMTTGSTFHSLKAEGEVAKEAATTTTTTTTRTRKQLLSLRNVQSKESPKSLIRKSAAEQLQPAESKEQLQASATLSASGKHDETYLLVVNKLNLDENEGSDNEADEFILTDYDDVVPTLEPDDKLLEQPKLQSSCSLQLQEATLEQTRIDLGAACEPASFPRLSCSCCGNSFPNQSQLNAHLRLHSNARSYECELCSKRFNAACNLTTHMRTHTGEKPFECTHCGRRFADRSTHRKHERMHTNERPYACNICGKNFSLSSTLKVHFLSHSKEKPHKCLTCNKGFRLPHQLKAHEKTHVHRYEMGVLQYSQEEGDYSSS
ncbi:hypothetical protein KR222_007143 [Zaprionus bogoriensis]|nr:hypothetical protein KR222_007143 [Zaprionus bogoriensis]